MPDTGPVQDHLLKGAPVGGQMAGGDARVADTNLYRAVFEDGVTGHGIADFGPVHLDVVLLHTAIGNEEHDGWQAGAFIGVGLQIFVELVAQRIGRWQDEVRTHPRSPPAHFGRQQRLERAVGNA